MTKYRIQLGLIVFLVIFSISLLLSRYASPDITPLFALKRIQEKIFLKLQSTPESQVKYMSSLLNVRLEELQSIVKNKSYTYVLPAASRYSTLAGQITDLIVANNLTDKIDVIKNQFLNHQKVIEKIYVAYPKNTDNWEWKYIQDDFNYLGLYLDQLAEVK